MRVNTKQMFVECLQSTNVEAYLKPTPTRDDCPCHALRCHPHTKSTAVGAPERLAARSDLANAGVPRAVLTRMTASGQLERAARGLYRLPDSGSSEHESLVTVANKVPQAVICLLSALQFHGLTTQLPRQVWIAMPRGSHTPRSPIRRSRWCNSPAMPMPRASRRTMRRVKLRVYSVAKTVADCFKHRNKIGLDVALEALKDADGSARRQGELRRPVALCQGVPRFQCDAALPGSGGVSCSGVHAAGDASKGKMDRWTRTQR